MDNPKLEQTKKTREKSPLEKFFERCEDFIENIPSMNPEVALEEYIRLRQDLNTKLMMSQVKHNTETAGHYDMYMMNVRCAAMRVIPEEIKQLEASDGAFENQARSKRKKTFQHWKTRGDLPKTLTRDKKDSGPKAVVEL
jgi:hypothetical protein